MKSDFEKESTSNILKKYGIFFKMQYQVLAFNCNNEILDDNKTFLPIQLLMSPHELVPITELVVSDNTFMTKVLSVFTSLCVEVNNLKEEAFEK